ncbi:MAG: hypothetical protein ACOYN0_07790 [Phycisphaerales bacterium]
MRPDVQRLIASCLSGVLRSDESFNPIRFVIDPRTGCPAAPLPSEAFDASSWSLYLPDDSPLSVQLTVTLQEVDPLNHDAADRWMAYFGRPKTPRFAVLPIDFCKVRDEALDGDEVRLVHPFRSRESALLRELAGSSEQLARACTALTGLQHPEAKAVGIDPYGVDVRVGLGVIRLEFKGDAQTEDVARVHLRDLLA